MIRKHIGVLVLASLLAIPAFADSRQDVVDHFTGPLEPTAKDATWTGDTMFAVGVLDDGSDRTGYAEYVCNVLRERGFRSVNARVVDIVKLVNGEGFVNLSKRVDCESFRRW